MVEGWIHKHVHIECLQQIEIEGPAHVSTYNCDDCSLLRMLFCVSFRLLGDNPSYRSIMIFFHSNIRKIISHNIEVIRHAVVRISGEKLDAMPVEIIIAWSHSILWVACNQTFWQKYFKMFNVIQQHFQRNIREINLNFTKTRIVPTLDVFPWTFTV